MVLLSENPSLTPVCIPFAVCSSDTSQPLSTEWKRGSFSEAKACFILLLCYLKTYCRLLAPQCASDCRWCKSLDLPLLSLVGISVHLTHSITLPVIPQCICRNYPWTPMSFTPCSPLTIKLKRTGIDVWHWSDFSVIKRDKETSWDLDILPLKNAFCERLTLIWIIFSENIPPSDRTHQDLDSSLGG